MAASDPFYRSSHGVSAVLHTSGGGSNNTSFTTAAADYTKDKLYCIAVLTTGAGATAPTISGGNINNWSKDVEKAFGSGHHLAVFTGICSNNATNASLTVDFGINNQDEVAWIVLLLDGATGVNNTDSASGTSATQSSTGLTFDHIRNATLSFTGIDAAAAISPPTIKQFSKLDEVQRAGGAPDALALQAQWRSSNQPTVETTTSSSHDYAICGLEIIAETLDTPIIWYTITPGPGGGQNRNNDPEPLLQAQIARKKPKFDYAHLLYDGPNIKIIGEWDGDPPFETMRIRLTSSPYPTTFQGIIWPDSEKWGDVDGFPGWQEDDNEAYRRMYENAREVQPSAAIAGMGIPQRGVPLINDRDPLADHFDIGCPFIYLRGWDSSTLKDIRTRIVYCVETLGRRCIPFFAGKHSGVPVVPDLIKHLTLGGYKIQRVLSMIRDETPAEGVVMWALTQNPNSTDRDLARWARYWQRMVLGTTIPNPIP